MSQKEGFSSGFILGSIVGGVIGGVLGTLLASRAQRSQQFSEQQELLEAGNQPQFTTEASIEKSRRSLEDKIAQLNSAIDDVRHQLGSVNGNAAEE
jgi:hypothetical protein